MIRHDLFRRLMTRIRRSQPISRSRKARDRFRLTLDSLEDRCVPATYTVTSLADAGAGTLRQAIIDANTVTPGVADNIDFTVSGLIALTADLPSINDAAGLSIDANAGTIELDGGFGGVSGIRVDDGPFTLNNFNIHDFLDGIDFFPGSAGHDLVLTNVNSHDNDFDGLDVDGGFTVAGNVTVTNSTFGNNADNGIEINDAGIVTLSGASVVAGNLNVTSVASMSFNATLTTANTATVTATGAIVDGAGAAISVTGLAHFSGSTITLDNAAANNYGQLRFNSAGAVAIVENSSTDIAGSNTALSLDLDSAGAITDAGGATVTVTNLADFNGTAITLNNAAANNYGQLRFNSAGAVAIVENSSTDIAGSNTALSLDLDSAGAITDAAGATINVTNLADFAGTAITLDNAASNNYGSLTFNSGGAVVVVENSSTNIAGANTAQTLNLLSVGGITDSADTDIAVAGQATINGTSITLGDTNPADVQNYGSLTFTSIGAVNITEDSSTALVGISTGTTIVLTSAGGISDSEVDAANEITGADLSLIAGGGIGTGAAPVHVNVTNLDLAKTGGGGIFVIDTLGGVTLTALTGANAIDDGAGGAAPVSAGSFVRAASPLTIAANALTSGGMTYTATDSAGVGDNLTVNGGVTVQDTTAGLTMNGGDNVLFSTTSVVRAFTGLIINGDFGNADLGTGSLITLNGRIQSDTASIVVNGDSDGDLVVIDDNGSAAGGSVDGVVTPVGITVNGNGGADLLSLEDSSDADADTFRITPTTIGVDPAGPTETNNYFDNSPEGVGLTYSSLETIDIQTSNIVTADGSQGDTIVVDGMNAGTVYNLDGNSPTGVGTGGPGDRIVMNPPGSILVYEQAGSYHFEFPGFPGSGVLNVTEFETIDIRPGNGQLVVLGDEGQGSVGNPAGTDEADTIAVTGTAANSGQIVINGIAQPPFVNFFGVTHLDINTFELGDQVTVTPFATTVQPWNIETDVNGGADTDRIVYNNVANLYDDTHVVATGLGAGRIDAIGVASVGPANDVVTFVGVEDITANANTGDSDDLTIDLTAGNNTATFLFDPDAGDDDVQLAGFFDVVVDSVNYDNLTVNGKDGDDTFNLALVGAGGGAAGALPLALSLNGGAPNASDTLVLTGNAGLPDDFTITPGANSQAGTAQIAGTDTGTTSFTGIENITLDGAGGVGADTVTMVGTGANNAFTLNGTGAFDGTARVDANPLVSFTGLGSDASSINLNGLAGSDSFSITGGALVGATSINVDGGDPTGNDTVIVNARAGVFDPMVVEPTAQGAGTVVSFGGMPDVNFAGTEHLKLVGQLADGDPFGVDGTTGDDLIEYFSGPTPDSGTILGTMNGGAFTLPDITFSGMQQASALIYNVFAQVGGTDTFIFNGTANNDNIFVGAAGTDIFITNLVNGQLFAGLVAGNMASGIVRGSAGNDVFTHDGAVTIPVSYEGGSQSTGDVLNFVGDGTAAVTVDLGAQGVAEAGFAVASYTGVERINSDAAGQDLTIAGTAGDDELAVTPTGADSALAVLNSSSPSVGPTPTVNGSNIGVLNVDLLAGTDRLVVSGTNVGEAIAVTGDLVTAGARETVNFVDVEDLHVNGLAGDDTFTITSSPTTTISIDGGDSVGALPGDRINLNVTLADVVKYSKGPSIDSGGFLINADLPISFVHIESKSYNTPSAMVVPDPVLLGKLMLVLVGSDGDDFITVRSIQRKDRFLVNIDGGPSLLFDFVTGHIKVTANKGDDVIYIQPSIKNPTILDGGAGNDSILSGAGNDVITSGLGSDTVDAGAGKDRLVEAGDVNMTLVQGTARVNGSLTSGPDIDVLIRNRIESAHLTGGPSANTLDASGFRLPVFLFGLGGNDTLIGTKSRDILVGGDGDDSLSGFGGVDILIGGMGLDTLIGGRANDLLVGGNTAFDTNLAALESVMSEWGRTNVGYPGRINHLLGTAPGGKNGTIFLNTTTVFNDGSIDNLTGGTKDRDWYLTSVGDVVNGLQPTETVTSIP